MTSKFVPSEIKVSGAPIKKSYQNALIKAQATKIWTDSRAGIRINPMSGEEVELNELEASVYDWCNRWYHTYSYFNDLITPIQTFDNMRYLFCALNSDAYMKLLD